MLVLIKYQIRLYKYINIHLEIPLCTEQLCFMFTYKDFSTNNEQGIYLIEETKKEIVLPENMTLK